MNFRANALRRINPAAQPDSSGVTL